MVFNVRINMGSKSKLSISGIYAPLPIRLLNAFARGPMSVFFEKPISLQVEDLLETAGRQTALADWGDPWFQEALTALLDSVNQEGKLTFFGRFSLSQFLIGNFCSRLRMIEVLKPPQQITENNDQDAIAILYLSLDSIPTKSANSFPTTSGTTIYPLNRNFNNKKLITTALKDP